MNYCTILQLATTRATCLAHCMPHVSIFSSFACDNLHSTMQVTLFYRRREKLTISWLCSFIDPGPGTSERLRQRVSCCTVWQPYIDRRRPLCLSILHWFRTYLTLSILNSPSRLLLAFLDYCRYEAERPILSCIIFASYFVISLDACYQLDTFSLSLHLINLISVVQMHC